METKLYKLSVHLVVPLTINHKANHHITTYFSQAFKFLKMSVRYKMITLTYGPAEPENAAREDEDPRPDDDPHRQGDPVDDIDLTS